MSCRNMLKVSVMLLALALAATSAHARLHLFGQLLTSKNQPDPNSGREKIPYLVCRRICDNCVCDRRAPQFAECYCEDRKPAAPLKKSEEVQVQLKGKSDVDESRRRIPYLECINNCDDCVACTRMWPPETNTCLCINNSKSKKPNTVV